MALFRSHETRHTPKTSLGFTPLGYAIFTQDDNAVNQLAVDADHGARDAWGNLAFHYVTWKKRQDYIGILGGIPRHMLNEPPNNAGQTMFLVDSDSGIKEERLKFEDHTCKCKDCPTRTFNHELDAERVCCYLETCKIITDGVPGLSPLTRGILRMFHGYAEYALNKLKCGVTTVDMYGNTVFHYIAYRDCAGFWNMCIPETPASVDISMLTNAAGQTVADVVSSKCLMMKVITDGRLPGFLADVFKYPIEPGCDNCKLSAVFESIPKSALPQCTPCVDESQQANQ